MNKYILTSLLLIAAILPFFMFQNRFCPFRQPLIEKQRAEKEKATYKIDIKTYQDNLLKYLKSRKDKLALIEIQKILSVEPNDTTGLWAKAEILRRAYKFKESEELLNQILAKNPCHIPSLISLSYIRYHDYKFEEALKILKLVLRQKDLDKENKALVYMLVGSINAKRASLGGFFSKIAYGTRIKGYFEKAKVLAPDLAEVRLGLGTFYLLAPSIIGGNVNKAIEELESAVKLTPDFATACARLAQGHKKKGNLEKYNFYLKQAKELDAENEVLKEIE